MHGLRSMSDIDEVLKEIDRKVEVMQTQQAKDAAKALFTHPFDVPVDVALAIHAVMHNKAGPEAWELFDFYIEQQGRNWLIECIKRTLVSNGVTNLEEELDWWENELLVG